MINYRFLLLSALFFSSYLQADEKLAVSNHRYQLGTDLFWSHYGSGSLHDEKGMKFKATVNGYFAGIKAGYDYLQPDAFYAGIEGIVAWGRDYILQKTTLSRFTTEQNCSCCSPQTKHSHESHLWANLEQRLGYNAQSTMLPQFIVTPYMGIGWHYESASGDHAHWYYGAAGLKTLQRFYERLEIGFDFKALFAFDIHDRMFLSVITTQEKKTFWGFETTIPVRWLMGETGRWDFEVKPYLLKLNLSSPQTIIGVRLAFGYSF